MRKKLRYLIVVVAVSILVLIPKPCHAILVELISDAVNGSETVALVVQQAAQFAQDFSIASKTWNDDLRKLDDLRRLAEAATTTKKGIKSIRKIYSAADHTIRTIQELERYVKYIAEFGDNYQITRAYSIHRTFVSKSQSLMNNGTSLIKEIGDIMDARPLQVLEAIDDAAESTEKAVVKEEGSAKTQLKDICRQITGSKIAGDNETFKKKKIRS